MQRAHAWISAACLFLLPALHGGCIIGFKVETSTSATASDDDSQSQSGSASSSTTEGGSGSTSDGSSEGTGTASEGTTAATDTSDATTDATDATTDATTNATTETGGAGECQVDADCTLASDCCACVGLPNGEPPDLCMSQCDTNRCESLGVTKAVCRFGTCETERVGCDDTKILCDAVPPQCPAGTVPMVDSMGVCYTGECVPPSMCDRVPECALCPPEMMCVSTVTLEGIPHTCEPIPVACGGVPSCACAANDVCDDVYYECSEQGSELTCSCPDC